MTLEDINHAPQSNSDIGRWSELARKKAEIIKPLVDLSPIPADKLAEACRRACVMLRKTEGEMSHQTIRNWLKDFERDGMDGLERKPRKTRGQSTLPPKLVEVIRGLFLSPKNYSIAKVHRLVSRFARQILKLKDEDLPTYRQVEYIGDQIPDDEKLMAHKGMRAFRGSNEIYIRFESVYPNQMWQLDHHLLDIIVVDPDNGKVLGRPWITAVEDDYSRAVCGYHISLEHPSSTSVALALRHAMLRKSQSWWIIHGIPEKCLIDNGWDFLSQHIRDACLHFGIDLQAHEPYHPQTKGKLERLFRTLEDMCIRDLDGYVGSNPQKRPYKVTPKLTLADVQVEIDQFIQDFHERPHGTTKVKPSVRWLDATQAIRPVSDADVLDYLLLSTKRKMRKDGLYFKKAPYLDLEGKLQKYIGKTLLLFYDPRDLSWVRVYATDNGKEQFVCTALAQTSNPTRIDAQTIRENNQRLRREKLKKIRKSQKDGLEAMEQLVKAEAAPENMIEGDGRHMQQDLTDIAEVMPHPPLVKASIPSTALGTSEVSNEDEDLNKWRRRARFRYKNEE